MVQPIRDSLIPYQEPGVLGLFAYMSHGECYHIYGGYVLVGHGWLQVGLPVPTPPPPQAGWVRKIM